MTTNALLISHIQNVFINPYTKDLPKAVEKLQHKYNTIIVFSFINEPGSFLERELEWKKCYKGTEQADLAFTPKKEAILLEHSNYSCLTPELKKIIKEKNIQHIDICGVDADACLLKTALDFTENNIRFSLLKDHISSSGGSYIDQATEIILTRNLGTKVFK